MGLCVWAHGQTTIASDVDEQHLRAAFDVLRQWVSDFDTPRMDDASSRLALPHATGVCVVLRRAGRVMGVGSDASGDDLMLRRAAGKAMNEVLAHPALASLTARLRQRQHDDPDAAITLDAIHADLGQSLAIELEVAGKLTPLIGRDIDQLVRKIEPGVDGVALRHGQTLELAFPAHLRALNTAGEPAKLLLNIALKSGLSLKEIGELPARQDLALYTFRTATLWQAASDLPPVHTVRGDILVPRDAVTPQSIARLADGIAQHLVVALWPDPPAPPPDSHQDASPADPPESVREPLGIMGDYRPVADQYRPLLAPPLDQALAAMALNRYAQAVDKGVDQTTAARAAAAATIIMRDLAAVTPAEDDPRDDLAACAIIVHAVREQPGLRNDPAVELLFKDAATRVVACFDPASGFVDRSAMGERSRGVPAHAQAMIAGSLCRLLTMSDAPAAVEAQRVRAALDAAWQAVPEPQHIALLPWIGWAELDYARATGQPLARVNEMRLMLDVLSEVRIKPSEADADDAARSQLIGGFALLTESGLGSAAPLATAQTCRPASWFASVIQRGEIVPPATIPTTLAEHLGTVRFLMQLSVRPDISPLYRNPARAVGGIRAALWDSDQPLPAQSLALITAVETLRIAAEHPARPASPTR